MSYSSSSLDDPLPHWTAYHPKKDVAWIPRRALSDQGCLSSPKPLRSRPSSLQENIISALDSVTAMMTSPITWRRRHSDVITHFSSTGSLPVTPQASPLQSSPKRLSFSVLRTLNRSRSGASIAKESLSTSNPDLDSLADLFEGQNSSGSYGSDKPDILKEAVEVDERIFGDRHEFTCVFINRRDLITGPLRMKDRHLSVCSGNLRRGRFGYPPYTTPVSIQIHSGLNVEEDRVNFYKNVLRVFQLRHEHVLRVAGLCVEGSPFTPCGVEVLIATQKTHFHVTLHRLLIWCRENNPAMLTPRCAITFCQQVCRGAQFLCRHKVHHRNLRAATVMLDMDCGVKLSCIEDLPVHTSQVGNTRWLPLETLHNATFTSHSIVWSVGVVLWEILSLGLLPYPHLSRTSDIYIYLAKGKRLIRPEGCSKLLYGILRQCWEERGRLRLQLDELDNRLGVYSHPLPPSPPAHQLFPNRDDFLEDDYI